MLKQVNILIKHIERNGHSDTAKRRLRRPRAAGLRPPSLHRRMMVHVNDAADAVSVRARIDTPTVSRDALTALLRQMESTVLDAAPGSPPVGAPPGPARGASDVQAE